MTTTPDLIEPEDKYLNKARHYIHNWLCSPELEDVLNGPMGDELERLVSGMLEDAEEGAITALESRQAAGVDAILDAAIKASRIIPHGSGYDRVVDIKVLREILAKHPDGMVIVPRGQFSEILSTLHQCACEIRNLSKHENPTLVTPDEILAVAESAEAMLDALPQPEVK